MEAGRRRPGGQGRAKELRKYAEQRALQKEAAREERKAEKEAAAKEAASASSAASASAEGERPVICKFFELGKCNKGAKCKFRHEVAAAAPADGDAGDAEAFDVIAKMPADAWLHIIARLGVAGDAMCSMAACCSALAAVAATKGVWEEKARAALWRRRRRHRRRVEQQRGAHRAARRAA